MNLDTIIKAIEKDYPNAHSFTKREMLKELRRIQILPKKWRSEEAEGGDAVDTAILQCADELENLVT